MTVRAHSTSHDGSVPERAHPAPLPRHGAANQDLPSALIPSHPAGGSPGLITIGTAAQLLGCSPRTVRRRVALGLIPAVREAGQVKVRTDDLATYIDSLEPVGTPRPRRRPHRAREYGFLTE